MVLAKLPGPAGGSGGVSSALPGAEQVGGSRGGDDLRRGEREGRWEMGGGRWVRVRVKRLGLGFSVREMGGRWGVVVREV